MVNVTALPSWAKKQISDDTSPPVSLTRNVDFPKGRWAQRAEKTIGVKSVYSDFVISFPSLQDRKADSDGSKDSSIDSGTESRTESRIFSESRTETSMKVKNSEFTVCPESFNELMRTSKQSSTSTVNIGRGDRRTLLTDDSALGSLRDQDLESTAHDGDIEDISDQENRTIQTLYYTTQQDSASGSEFPVNAMDIEELRRSQKKLKRPNLPLVSVTTASVSGSQDSEDDDDEASTPSGEATDRNPMSMFSVSSESLDQIVNREKYLQSTFESLSGNELDTSIAGGKTSISSQHHTRNGTPIQLRNMAVINAAKQIKTDPEATKKREELNKRIEETRRKLQSVGYRSNLKSSQSITDLSNVPERDNWNAPTRQQVHFNTETESNLRRACSLSDLTIPGAYKPKLQVSGKINQNKPTVPARTNLRNVKGSNMTRSSSTGVLNQSDSDQETPKASIRNSLMRPTISSQNKVSSSTKSNLVRRRLPQSSSTMNLSTVGQEDSSSEEASPSMTGSKPIVPPRPRSIMGDNLIQPVIVPRRHTAAQKEKLKINRHTPENEVNIKTAQISSQLCHQIAEDLSTAADNVISLYKRLSSTSPNPNQLDNLATSQKQNLAKTLENSVHKNLQILQEIFASKQNGASQNGSHSHFDSPTTETIKKLNELSTQELSGGAGDQTNVVTFMQQYSDILLNIMQQKMSSVKK